MGVSMADIQKGVLDTGKLIVEGMKTWDLVTHGSDESKSPTVAQPSVANAQEVATQPMGAAAMDGMQWALMIGAVVLAIVLLRR